MTHANVVRAERMSAWDVAQLIKSRVSPDLRGPLVLRVCHQPNLLAYWKLIGQLLFAIEVSVQLKSDGLDCELSYVLNDYDSWRDDRFRRAVLPLMNAPSPVQYINLRPEQSCPRSKIIAALGRMPTSFASYFRHQTIGAISSIVSSLNHREGNRLTKVARDVASDIGDIMRTVEIWPEFCAQYIQRIVQEYTGGHELRVSSGFEVIRQSQTIIREVIAKVETFDTNLAAQVWYYCRSCGIRFTHVDKTIRLACTQCDATFRDEEAVIIPKVLVDDLVDDSIYGQSIEFSHSGSLEHILQSNDVATQMGSPSTRLHVVSSRGERPDHIAQMLLRDRSADSIVSRISPRGVDALVNNAPLGYYSSMYYLIGDRLRGTSNVNGQY